jgi:hypothetical protein
MDEEVEMVFGEELWGEFMIDLDYEFDAPKYFDLSTEEPAVQATSAEKWFDTAKSDPLNRKPLYTIINQNYLQNFIIF